MVVCPYVEIDKLILNLSLFNIALLYGAQGCRTMGYLV